MRLALPLIAVLTGLGWLVLTRVRPGGGWRIAPVLVMIVAALIGLNELRWASFENRLAHAAAPVLAGRDSSFGCERITRNFFSSTGHVGHVYFDAEGNPADDAFLSMNTCARLKDWMKHPEPSDERQLIAVHTLSHEGAHLAGIRDEGKAECAAMAADEQVMINLGANPATAAAAAARYRSQIYPHLASEYTSGGC